MNAEIPEVAQRGTPKRRSALVLPILRGETSVAEGARQHAVTVAEVEDWRDRFLLGAENALRSRPRNEEALKDEQIKQLRQKVGELVVDLHICRRRRSCALRSRGRSSRGGRAPRQLLPPRL
jgi:transposase-like protein